MSIAQYHIDFTSSSSASAFESIPFDDAVDTVLATQEHRVPYNSIAYDDRLVLSVAKIMKYVNDGYLDVENSTSRFMIATHQSINPSTHVATLNGAWAVATDAINDAGVVILGRNLSDHNKVKILSDCPPSLKCDVSGRIKLIQDACRDAVSSILQREKDLEASLEPSKLTPSPMHVNMYGTREWSVLVRQVIDQVRIEAPLNQVLSLVTARTASPTNAEFILHLANQLVNTQPLPDIVQQRCAFPAFCFDFQEN
jgi:hypothetical protein